MAQMRDERPNPDALLASLNKQDAKSNRGKLKIFLGMSPGVGKTYAMLQAARQRHSEGVDVLVGVIETHGRKETQALLEGLVIASKIKIPYRDTILEEMDLDTILAIRPQLVLVDELAHSNVPGSRHPKRYQDVQEILASGIDVYTTLNVQHVESRSETVRQITGVQVQETVPDSVLDMADEIALIDLTPEQLRERLKEGKVYLGDRAAAAAENFFRTENLTALREMSLRVTAEHVNHDLREIMTEQKIDGPWKSGDCLMVAVGATPFSESLIRWTRRMAMSLDAAWIAIYVETQEDLNEEEKKRLMSNLALARKLGAEVIVKAGVDIAETLLQVARENNVTQICIGKPHRSLFWEMFGKNNFVHKLIKQSGNIDIHMVRVNALGSSGRKHDYHVVWPSFKEMMAVMLILSVITVVSLVVEKIVGYNAVSLIYLVAVVASGIYLSRWTVFILGASGACVWNYLFIEPRYTLYIEKSYDVMMFVMFFLMALIVGQITVRLRQRERSEQQQEKRVTALYQLTRAVAMTPDPQQAIHLSLEKLEHFLNVQTAIFLTHRNGRPNFDVAHGGGLSLSKEEKSVANWAFQKQQAAGRFTDTLPEAEYFYLPLVSMDKTLGVLAIKPQKGHTWTSAEHNVLESFASLMTVSLEKQMLSLMTEDAKVKAAAEKFQTSLLDSVSHELKTPLAVIVESAEHLEQKGLDRETFHKFVGEIRTASQRLLQTVNDLLDMTRLDSGAVHLNMEWHDMHDVINKVLEQLASILQHHKVQVHYDPLLPLVRIDHTVIQHVLTNLISNALFYSPEKSKILISVQMDQKVLYINVIDQGPGIDPEDLDKIFEKFYQGKHSRPGGLGLGLSIAKQFVTAHGGSLKAVNHEHGGACFSIILPVESFSEELS